MKFIVDAQLLYRLEIWLIAQGFDAITPKAYREPMKPRTWVLQILPKVITAQ